MNRSFIDDNGNPCDQDKEDQYDYHRHFVVSEEDADPSIINHHMMHEGEEETNHHHEGGVDEPPRYFINAAELSEDDTSFIPEEIRNVEDNTNQDKLKKSGGESRGDNPITTCRIPRRRGRVPHSKSYPDIVQTTFKEDGMDKDHQDEIKTALPGIPGPSIPSGGWNKGQGHQGDMKKDNSDLESCYVADSLEELALSPKEEEESKRPEKDEIEISTSSGIRPPRAFLDNPPKPQAPPPPPSSRILESSALMTESQMASGIIAEKPPEAWVIDLNSLSMDSQQGQGGSERRSQGSGSNPNSLAFFVDIDNPLGEEESRRRRKGEEEMSRSMTSSGAEKKIFSMFVDIKEGEGTPPSSSSASKRSQIPNLRKPLPPHQNPKMTSSTSSNIMERSTDSLKSGKTYCRNKFASPTSSITQQKAAAEAARKAARLEWEKQKEKYLEGLEPHSRKMLMDACKLGDDSTTMMMMSSFGVGMLGESYMSNRSSLHVANVLDSSFNSSIISSMEAEASQGDMETCQGGPCFKLGKDLLRMFQDGINTDVIISVQGKWIKAHKCILASRSQYFAAILSGHWVEKAGNTINLDGFSYPVVQFALYHIYSGTNEIPDTIDLLELAQLTDLLGLEGLRENIGQTFRVKYCHNFHRPCTGCITGVLECFPIASNYGMEELHRKMIKWICKHFVRIWPTKGFANLGEELMNKCLQYSINHLSVDNILDHTLGCDQLTTTMPTLRWTEPIFNLVNQLGEECIQFLGQNLSEVLQSQKFLQFGKGQSWNISRIEGTFMQALTLLRPDIACLSHTALQRLIELGTETIDEVEWSTTFVDFLKMLRAEVEKFLLANASKAVLSKCWEELDPQIRKKICSTSFVGLDKHGNKIIKNTGAVNQVKKGGGNNSTSIRPDVVRQSSASSSRGTSGTTKPRPKVASVRPQPKMVEPPPPPPPDSDYERSESSCSNSTAAPVSLRHNNNGRPNRMSLANQGRSSTMSSTKTSSEKESTTSSGRPVTAGPSGGRNNKGLNRPTAISRRASESTASPTRCRTPTKPLTPSVPPKSSPLLGGNTGNGTNNSSSGGNSTSNSAKTRKALSLVARNHALAREQLKPPAEPPKKQFLSNSAKAAAVSKPVLKPRKELLELVVEKPSTPTPMSRQNSKPGSGTSTRTSLVERQTKPSSSSSRVPQDPPQQRNQSRISSAKIQSTTTTTRRPVSGSSNIAGRSNQNSAKPSSSSTVLKKPATTTTTTTRAPQVPQNIPDFQTFAESFQPDHSNSTMMSRSTIETSDNNGEVKMRTLAEIGRSSTFSKDEPTVLGKMEGSGYGEDYGDDYDEDQDDDNYDYDDDYEEEE